MEVLGDIIASVIILYFFYLSSKGQDNKTKPVKNNEYNEHFSDDYIRGLIIKKRDAYTKRCFRIMNVYNRTVDNTKHDYQILTRTAFGSTQAKVIDLGPDVKTTRTGTCQLAMKGYKPSVFMYLSKELYEQAEKSPTISKLLWKNRMPKYSDQKCIHNNDLSPKEAQDLLNWLGGDNI